MLFELAVVGIILVGIPHDKTKNKGNFSDGTYPGAEAT